MNQDVATYPQLLSGAFASSVVNSALATNLFLVPLTEIFQFNRVVFVV
uniref:Uncharacterized protein n=1 Tax=Utricularia reniformis TaxID=192314 RepID=A0A1Y0B0Y1_9LAMI|nr:hypothetical protein AEK19_MT0791 [Utricularia reniformis]ART31031.1 hypothetical protein AEK19_MT0791 [Utricularia reniformis]